MSYTSIVTDTIKKIMLWYHMLVKLICSNMVSYILAWAEVTSTPTRPVENVVITMKGLQDRNNLLLEGRTVENKGKLIHQAESPTAVGFLH